MEITFKQIAGLLARRIVFKPQMGDRVERGQRVGLIKFGSRVDIIFPAEAQPKVKVGNRVKGGETVLAVMPESTLGAGTATATATASAAAGAGLRGGAI
jgi:phosphatidylserine decarboxylase